MNHIDEKVRKLEEEIEFLKKVRRALGANPEQRILFIDEQIKVAKDLVYLHDDLWWQTNVTRDQEEIERLTDLRNELLRKLGEITFKQMREEERVIR